MKQDDEYFEELWERSPYKEQPKKMIRTRFYLALNSMSNHISTLKQGYRPDNPRTIVNLFNKNTGHKLDKYKYELEYILVARLHYLSDHYKNSIRKPLQSYG